MLTFQTRRLGLGAYGLAVSPNQESQVHSSIVTQTRVADPRTEQEYMYLVQWIWNWKDKSKRYLAGNVDDINVTVNSLIGDAVGTMIPAIDHHLSVYGGLSMVAGSAGQEAKRRIAVLQGEKAQINQLIHDLRSNAGRINAIQAKVIERFEKADAAAAREQERLLEDARRKDPLGLVRDIWPGEGAPPAGECDGLFGQIRCTLADAKAVVWAGAALVGAVVIYKLVR